MTTETANSKSKPKSNKTSAGFTSLMSVLAIVISLVAGVLIYKFIFGDPGNFVDGDTNGEPLDGSLLATIYKGGVIVPILVAVNLIIIIFSVERFITLSMAAGRGKTNSFVNKIKSLLSAGQKMLVLSLAARRKAKNIPKRFLQWPCFMMQYQFGFLIIHFRVTFRNGNYRFLSKRGRCPGYFTCKPNKWKAKC